MAEGYCMAGMRRHVWEEILRTMGPEWLKYAGVTVTVVCPACHDEAARGTLRCDTCGKGDQKNDPRLCD